MLEIPKKSHGVLIGSNWIKTSLRFAALKKKTIYGKSPRNKHLLDVRFSQKLNSSQPSCFDFNGSQKFKLQELIFI